MTRLLHTLGRAIPSVGLAALTWSVAAQAQTVFNACVTPLTGLLYQPKEAGKCFLPTHPAIHWTDGLGAFLGATTLGGDLSGTLPSPTVKGLRGHPVSAANPTTGQVLIWDGSVWAPGNQVGGSSGAAGGALTGTYPNPALAEGVVTSAALGNGSVTEPKLAFNPATQEELEAAIAAAAAASVTLQTNINAVNEAIAAYKALLSNSGGTANAVSNPLSWSQLKDVPSGVISGGGASGVAGGDLSGTYPNPSVAKLQNTAVSAEAPANGQVLTFNGSAWGPAALASPAGGLPCAGCVNEASIADGAVTHAKLATDVFAAVAFAYVDVNGSQCVLGAHSANVTACAKDIAGPADRVFITVAGIQDPEKYVTIFSPIRGDVQSDLFSGGHMTVYLTTSSGTRQFSNFSFVMFKMR